VIALDVLLLLLEVGGEGEGGRRGHGVGKIDCLSFSPTIDSIYMGGDRINPLSFPLQCHQCG